MPLFRICAHDEDDTGSGGGFAAWMDWQIDAERRGDSGLGQDGKPHQELSGVASLRFPQHPPGGTCPPPL